MNNVNKTLYIPLYGKAYVSKKNIILKDKKAEEIWDKEGFELKGKSKTKWLAYYMAMRSAIYDEWVEEQIRSNPDAVVLHIGCGLDSRIDRIKAQDTTWYDIDFPEVIEERSSYYTETNNYYMLAADMRYNQWKEYIEAGQEAIVILEGVSMYFAPDEFEKLLTGLAEHFTSVKVLVDCYTKKAAKISKYKNPINDVGVTEVYGYDTPEALKGESSLRFVKEYEMTPQKYIDELEGMEKIIFKKLYAGAVSKAMYKMYEFHSDKE